MRMTLLAGVAALVLASSVSTSANSAIVPLGTLAVGEPVLTSGTIVPANGFDIITFSIGGVSDLSASLRNLFVSVRGVTFNFASLSASFYQGTYSGTPGVGTFVGTLTAGADTNYLSLAGGDYYAKVSGIRAAGASGGLYALALLAGRPASPAPGPGGALVAGTALTALMFRRRQKAKAVAA